MSKNLFIIAVFMLAALILVACGNQPATPTEPASSSMQASSKQSSQEASSEAAVSSTDSASSTASISSDAASSEEGMVSFSKDILPLLQKRCVNCHGGQRTEKELKLNSYDGVMTGSENGPVVIPGDPANSSFVDLVQQQKMPKRGTKLTPEEVKFFSDWVLQGAPNN